MCIQLHTANENAQLERDRRMNDQKKRNFDRQLRGKQMTQLDYDRKVQALEQEQEKRAHAVAVRQFRRQQRMQIAQALMSGAQAVASTIAAMPGAFDIATLGAARAVQIGLMIATTAAQVATIAGQKPPQYVRGGKLRGPDHARGGVQIYSRNGHHFGEAEGGEVIINRRTIRDRNVYQVSGTPAAITSKLNSLHGGVEWEGGATLKHVWRTASPARMNFTAINTTIRQHKFAQGGVLSDKGAVPVPSPQDGQQMQLLLELTQSVNNLNALLASGITAYTSITQHNAQQERLNNIKRDATMR